MTIDVPVDTAKGNVIDLCSSLMGAEASPSSPGNSKINKIPVVILKKLEDDNKYFIVSSRSSNRNRTIKSFQNFEMDLSTANLKRIENNSVSPRKRGRPIKTNGDLDMSSPTKIQKTPKKSQSTEGDIEENVANLCKSLKNTVKLRTPVERSLNETDFCDVELMDNSFSPKKKETPVKNQGRGLRKLANRSPTKTNENELTLSGKYHPQTPKIQDVSSKIKMNLNESFRRSVLKSKLNVENVQKESDLQTGVITRGSTAKLSTRTKPGQVARRSARTSYARFFYCDNDSDETQERIITKQNEKVASAKRRIWRSRNNSSSSSASDLLLEDESDPGDDKKSTRYQRRRLKSESESDHYDSKSPEIVQPKTPSRRKQILRPRKDSTASNASEKSELSTEKKPPKEIARAIRSRKESVTSNASDKSPERRPLREIAKTPKTPRSRNAITATPKSIKATPKTPKNRLKLLRDGMITPSMHSRSSLIAGDSTPLMKARSQLHVSYVPTSLPCREKEYLDVHNFLKGKLEDGYGGCMYISGVPGTGKTATVTSVIVNLQNDKKVPKFSYISVNGMRLTEPRQSYVEIWKQLTGKTIPWEQAQSLLEERFTKRKNLGPVVMLIDELDILCTKRQDVVYNLLDWPSKSKDQLVVVTIANTMDLPERLLMSRVTSRLGLTRLTFQAYTHKQLMEIVMKRLTGTNSFNPDAIQLVARKVASVSGDARRALDICRRAAEIAEEEGKAQLVNIMHINEALNAMITQPQVMAIKRCSRLQKLLLQAIVAEIERTGVEETTFNDVFRILVSCCALDGFKMVTSTVAQRAICELSAYRLIITDQKCSHIFQKIILNVSVHDVYFALKKE